MPPPHTAGEEETLEEPTAVLGTALERIVTDASSHAARLELILSSTGVQRELLVG